MIQSHLLQVLALVAMEPIAAVNAMDLSDAKAQGVTGLSAMERRPGQSDAGLVPSAAHRWPEVPDYTAEPGVDPARNTETLAELIVEIDNSALVRGAVPGCGRARR